ncbi:hypothetical protein OG496_41000 [Streptomyces sp. NBC_00988]|uniref:hypothetical protein n=1 Tax=Streptomyces sp. NBC_00988 TaxID=2903704 RepID=UPI00386EBE50|nr:hypothetical protein OG496_41000 [Streptomyces sp. NBC_00988]
MARVPSVATRQSMYGSGRAAAGPAPVAPRRLPDTVAARAIPRGRAATVLIGLGLAMLPWLVVLHTCLPGTAESAHWAWAWTGLDGLEAAGLLGTGLLLRCGDPRACLTAVAAATLLLVDAWFDIMTAAPGADLTSAVLMAVCAELPLAGACAALAIRAFPRPER